MSQMYLVNGRYVTAAEARKLRSQDGKQPIEEKDDEQPIEEKKGKKSKK